MTDPADTPDPLAVDPRTRWRAGVSLMGPLAWSFVLPVIGPFLSIASPIRAGREGPKVWSERAPAGAAAVTALVAVWFFPIFGVFVVPSLPRELGMVLPWMHYWLLIPLCGPGTLASWVLPPLGAVLVYAAGSAASVRWQRPWLWPVAAFGAAYAYTGIHVALEAIGWGRFIC